MTSRTKIINALANQNSGRPPLWVMRQAGRYLPEYRALKEKYSFLEMVKSPELAVEVTLQPMLRFELDAAIIFSDILVIPEAMGQPYHFREQGGIGMNFRLKGKSCLDKLDTHESVNKLSYVGEALTLLRSKLDSSKAMLGFCGSPWTLACYMVDGGSTNQFPKTVQWAKSSPASFALLLEKLTTVLIDYVKMQAQSGVDAIQIFDSWNALCPDSKVYEWSLKWIDQIADAVSDQVPVILYAKAPSDRLKLFSKSKVSGISVDHETDLRSARKSLPSGFTLQGNLNPALLESEPEIVKNTTLELLNKMKGDPGHILNLGHGIRPQAKIDCMHALVQTVREFN
ncbi:MAG: uroporphyrinogen decarboxylase [Opitutae bacterium]|nr:uroporphyrinogen decarboxylase [Opitutae bacterium]